MKRDILDDGAAEVEKLLFNFSGGQDKTDAAGEAPCQHCVGAQEKLQRGREIGSS